MFLLPEALAQPGGVQAVALETESTHVGEIAFAAALGDRQDVIGVPEGFAAAHRPFGGGPRASRTSEALDSVKLGDAVEMANGADTAIASENTFAKVAGVTAQLPFFDAPIGTEGQPSRRDLKTAPTAEATAVFACSQGLPIDAATTRHCAFSRHAHRILAGGRRPAGTSY